MWLKRLVLVVWRQRGERCQAVLLNGITKYDPQGGYTIKDTADKVSKSSVEILGDAVSVTLSDVAAAGALINGLDKGQSTTDITFNVVDSPPIWLPTQRIWMWLTVNVGSAGDNEVSVAEAVLLNGITNTTSGRLHDQGHCR